MRLSKLGLAAAAASIVWMLCGQAVAAQQNAAELARGASDDPVALAWTSESGSAFPQSPLPNRFSTDSGILQANGARTRLAMATPALIQQRSPGALSAASVASHIAARPEQPPSRWLMGGVILLLLGYQLRRKHRFLRPHRFNSL